MDSLWISTCWTEGCDGAGATAKANKAELKNQRLPFVINRASQKTSFNATCWLRAGRLLTDSARRGGSDDGTVIEDQRIVELPLNGRNYLQLSALSPNVASGFNIQGGTSAGAATTRLGGERSTQAIAISGTKREFIYHSIDGVNNTEPNFNSYIFQPSIDAIQEFKVQSGIYSAEFGRGIGQVNVSTKSGTNDYHGTLFEFLRNSVMDARPFAFTSSVPVHSPFKENEDGFTLGGPLSIPKLFNAKNKLFFMSNYEGKRVRQQTQTVDSVPDAAMRMGNFSEILPNTRIVDPSNRDANGNKLPFCGQHHPAIGVIADLVGATAVLPTAQYSRRRPGQQLSATR